MKNISLKTLMVMLGACAIFLLSSCSKDDATPNETKLLTDGAWQLTAMTSNPPIDWFGTPVTDVYAQLPTCVKDDLAIFKTNGTVNFDEGASKCEPNDPQTKTGTWAFNTDETVLSVTEDGETESWDITELKGDTFKVVYRVTQEGLTYTFSAIFKRK